MNTKVPEVSGIAKHAELVELWKHFTPHNLIFLTSLVADDGEFDSASVSAMADSNTAALDTLLAASEIDTNYRRLRCLRRERDLSSYDEVFLARAVFRAYDCTLTGDSNQDAATLTAIEDSLTSNNDAYMQSRFRFAEIGGWEPNFFNPSIKLRHLKGKSVLAGYEFSNYSTTVQNKGDLSIGASLPFTFEPTFPVSIGKIPDDAKGSIIIHARAAQLVEGKQQPYPIVCELELLGYKKGDAK